MQQPVPPEQVTALLALYGRTGSVCGEHPPDSEQAPVKYFELLAP